MDSGEATLETITKLMERLMNRMSMVEDKLSSAMRDPGVEERLAAVEGVMVMLTKERVNPDMQVRLDELDEMQRSSEARLERVEDMASRVPGQDGGGDGGG